MVLVVTASTRNHQRDLHHLRFMAISLDTLAAAAVRRDDCETGVE